MIQPYSYTEEKIENVELSEVVVVDGIVGEVCEVGKHLELVFLSARVLKLGDQGLEVLEPPHSPFSRLSLNLRLAGEHLI